MGLPQKVRSFWQRQLTGTTSERWLFVSAAIALAVDTWLIQSYPSSPVTAGLSLCLIASLFFTGFSPAWGGICLVSLLIISSLTNSDVGLLRMSIYLLVGNWIYRGWYLPAVLAPLLVAGTNLMMTGNTGLIITFGLGMEIAIPIGLGLRRQSQRTGLLEEQIQGLPETPDETVERLRTDLHDTVAKDLTRLTLAAQRLPTEENIAERAQQMENLARESLTTVRTLIKGYASTTPDQTTSDMVAACRALLDEKRIILQTGGITNLQPPMTTSQAEVMSQGIQEGALNIFKYGRRDSVASLELTVTGDKTITMTLSNKVAISPNSSAWKNGGYGLIHLAAKAEAAGGIVCWRHDEDEWTLTVSVPAMPGPTRAKGAFRASET